MLSAVLLFAMAASSHSSISSFWCVFRFISACTATNPAFVFFCLATHRSFLRMARQLRSSQYLPMRRQHRYSLRPPIPAI